MRLAAGFVPSNFRQNPLVVFGFFAFVVFAAYQSAQYVINDDLVGLAYVAMLFVGAAFVVAMLNDWRRGLYFFLAWLLFEDFARKFLGNNMAIYFAKDFLVAVVYLAYFIAYRRKEVKTFRPPFRVALLLLIWLGAMQIFNPNSTSIFYGLMGMKLYFYYIPLLFIGYSLFRDEKDLRRFFFFNVLLSLLIVSLGVAQSVLGHTFLNPAVQTEELRDLSTNYRVAPVSGVIAYRPTSIFVSTGRYTDFIFVMWLAILGFSGYLLLRHKKGRLLAFVSLAVTAGGAALSASRASFVLAIINAIVTTIAFVWGAPWRQGQVTRVFRGIQRAALGIVLATTLLFMIFPDTLMSRVALYQETLNPNSKSSELGDRAWDYPLRNFIGAFNYEHWATGYGIGTASLGGQYVSKIFHVTAPTNGTESGFGTLVLEMGVLGVGFWLIMAAAISFSAWSVIKKLKGTPWFPLGFVIGWYAFMLLLPYTFLGIQAYQDFVLNAYLWLLLGILFRLPSLALSAQYAALAPTAKTQERWAR